MEVSRENYDLQWLVVSRTDGTAYAEFEATENLSVRPLIRNALSQAIVDHHVSRERVAYLLTKQGFEKAGSALAKRLPTDRNTRIGNFGEVVCSEHLRQRYKLKLPLFKLRYADNFKLPMRGEDIVAFEMEGNTIVRFCVGEAKAMSSFRKDRVIKAHERLKTGCHPFPVSLSMITNILHDRGESELANQIEDIIEQLTVDAFPRSNWIFVITSDQRPECFDTLKQLESLLPDLNCVRLHVDTLSEFVDDLFNNPVALEVS